VLSEGRDDERERWFRRYPHDARTGTRAREERFVD
jgi:hypothetical protein